MIPASPARLVSLVVAAFLLGSMGADAIPPMLDDWEALYGGASSSAQGAGCRLCHAHSGGGSPWNGYGWSLLTALRDSSCDSDGDKSVSTTEALSCIEALNSDGDSSGHSNLVEIRAGRQPGWTGGPNNMLYTLSGPIPDQRPPEAMMPVDPDGTGPDIARPLLPEIAPR